MQLRAASTARAPRAAEKNLSISWFDTCFRFDCSRSPKAAFASSVHPDHDADGESVGARPRAGLELGATTTHQPFSIRELVARVKALFRRIEQLETASEAQTEEVLRFGALEADLLKREMRADGKPVALTSKEFDLLLHFLRSPGRVYSRLQLLDAVWGYGYEGYEHNVNCHINRLRAKIEADPAAPRFILTVRGVGYRLGDPRPAQEQ